MNFPLPSKYSVRHAPEYFAIPEYNRQKKGNAILIINFKESFISLPKSVTVGGGSILGDESPLGQLLKASVLIVGGVAALYALKIIRNKRR